MHRKPLPLPLLQVRKKASAPVCQAVPLSHRPAHMMGIAFQVSHPPDHGSSPCSLLISSSPILSDKASDKKQGFRMQSLVTGQNLLWHTINWQSTF